MNTEKLYNVTADVLAQLKNGGAEIAYCTARTSETLEFNVDGGEFSLLRTLFDNGLSMTAIKGGKKGSVGSNSFEADSVKTTVESCLAAAESSEPDEAWDIAGNFGDSAGRRVLWIGSAVSGAATPTVNLSAGCGLTTFLMIASTCGGAKSLEEIP